MKVLIELPEETLVELQLIADAKGWSRKKFIQIRLNTLAEFSKKSREKKTNQNDKQS